MYLHIPLLLFLLTNVVSSDANIFVRSSESFVRAASAAHQHAIKRSSGLVRDLRLALSPLLITQEQVSGAGRAFCVSSAGLTSSNSTGGNSSTVTSASSGAQSSTATATDSGRATSPVVSASINTSSGTTTATSSGSVTSPVASASVSASPWILTQTYQGSSFFNGWNFFTFSDPTNGIVSYVDQDTAQSANLIEINSAGNAVMRVETTPTVTNTRQSVRITTSYTYTGGLVILDSVHMPTGCGTWPAFWSNGASGEIDIVEGVNDYTNNQATIHTNNGCSLTTTNTAALAITGTVVTGTNCSAAQTGNPGCGIRASQTDSFGAAFNAVNGGIYAMRWDDSGIAVWFFASGSVPADINVGAPLPDGWGIPMAQWPAAGCDPFQFFQDHSLIFDTTLCGDWASGVWASTGVPGQDQSCATRTGYSTCEDFVRSSGSSFSDAYWEVRSVKIYQTSS